MLRDINTILDFSSGGIGILGAKGSGKTTLLNILAGIVLPDYGRVIKSVSVSWPISWRGFSGEITGAGFIMFICRIYRLDYKTLLRFVAEISGLGSKLYAPVKRYTGREKDRLMQAVALGVDFDVYLVDESLPSIEQPFAADYEAAWKSRFRQAAVIVVSSHVSKIEQITNTCAILERGQLLPSMQIEEARTAFELLMRQKAENHSKDEKSRY